MGRLSEGQRGEKPIGVGNQKGETAKPTPKGRTAGRTRKKKDPRQSQGLQWMKQKITRGGLRRTKAMEKNIHKKVGDSTRKSGVTNTKRGTRNVDGAPKCWSKNEGYKGGLGREKAKSIKGGPKVRGYPPIRGKGGGEGKLSVKKRKV